MTQEEKQLLFRDLCGRLPYDVIVQETFQNVKRDVPIWDCGPHYIKDHLEKVKPYLHPMSSMTEEEKVEVSNLFSLRNKLEILATGKIQDDYFTIETIDWLNAHHFDYRGLIEKGLALEAPKDMYK